MAPQLSSESIQLASPMVQLIVKMVDETFSIHYIKELWWRHWHPPTSNKGNNVQLYQGTANWVISLNRVSVRGSSIFYKMQTTTAIVSSQKSILCSAAPGQSFKGILVGNQTPQGWVKSNSDSSPPWAGLSISHLTASPASIVSKGKSHLWRGQSPLPGEQFPSLSFKKGSSPYRSHNKIVLR